MLYIYLAKFEFRSKKFTQTYIHLPHSDCVVKMNPSQPSVSVRHSVGLTTVMLPNGFKSIPALLESQQELTKKYNKLRSVYEPLETQFHELDDEAVQLNKKTGHTQI